MPDREASKAFTALQVDPMSRLRTWWLAGPERSAHLYLDKQEHGKRCECELQDDEQPVVRGESSDPEIAVLRALTLLEQK